MILKLFWNYSFSSFFFLKKLFLLCVLGYLGQLTADSYHNINGFFGERASGMGGAYTAISDDPSGGYYNPAGLAYAYDSSISLSASNYTTGKKNYNNVLGPGQGYDREFRNYIPNFFGLVKETEQGARIGFSILNPINDSFQRNDQIQLPLYYPAISNFKLYNRETYNNINIGLSYAKALVPGKFSYGVSLYYLQDTASISNSGLVQFKDKTYIVQTNSDNRTTRGLIPVLGLMYTPIDKLSFGLSVRRIIVTSQNRLINSFQIDSTAGGTEGILFIEGTHKAFGGSIGDTIYRGPSYSGKIPEVTEVRLGTAFFPNKNLVASFDVIYTSGYSRKTNNTEILYGGGLPTTITLSDNEDLELKRYATTNFAFGLEYYLTEYLSLRLGSFTNYANTKNQTWLTSAMIAYNRQIAGDSETILNDGSTVVNYKPQALRDNPRNEYVDTIGYTLGFSFSTAKSSIGINLIKEYGRGHAKLDSDRANQPLVYDSTSIYVVVSSKNN